MMINSARPHIAAERIIGMFNEKYARIPMSMKKIPASTMP